MSILRSRRRPGFASGVLTTIAGNGNFGYTGDGGPATSATLRLGTGGLSGLAVDASGNVYFSDSSNNVVRKVTTAGIISTYAGNGTGAGTGGKGAVEQTGRIPRNYKINLGLE